MDLFASSDDTPARQYWQLWQDGKATHLGLFLRGHPWLTPEQLAEVLRVDQRQRWQQQQPVAAEEYLRLYPELAAHPEAALDLVYGEYLLREQAGETPSWQDYADRFPDLADGLRRQIELHEALGTSDRRTVRDEAPAVVLPTLPGYEVLERLGHGGMGVVYKARQLSLNRVVAVKMLFDSAAADANQRARFMA